MAIEIVDLPIKNGDLPIKKGDFPDRHRIPRRPGLAYLGAGGDSR